MKKISLLIIAFATFSCTQAQKTQAHKPEDPIAFSETALSQTLLAADGNQVLFKDIMEKQKGKTTLIEVWASWCSDCVKAMPDLKELQAKNPKVSYVFLSMDKTADKWKAGIEKHELKGLHFMANDGMKGVFGTAINLDWIPRYIIIDKKGKIVLYRAIETDFDQINEELKKIQK